MRAPGDGFVKEGKRVREASRRRARVRPPGHAVDARDAAPGRMRRIALDVDAEVDGLGDKRARGRVDHFLDQLAPAETRTWSLFGAVH
jgi:hypothetical protein